MNSDIIDQFKKLVNQIKAEYLNSQIENETQEIKMHQFRLQSVKKILNIIQKLNFEITDSSDLINIPGIGKGTIQRIDEILKTGKLSELNTKYIKSKQKKIDNIQELEKIIGIGSSVANKLVTTHNIKSIQELKKAIKSNKIKVNNTILMGLKYYGVVQEKIPRKEISIIEKYLVGEAHKINSKLEIMICGSYRRGNKTSGDIDVLLYHPDVKTAQQLLNPTKTQSYLEKLIDQLSVDGFLIDDLTYKNKKYMGFCKYKSYSVMRIDIRYVPYVSLPTAMLYFTGPYELNTAMRSTAKKRNMILNEYGLYKIDSNQNKIPIKIKSEEDVFKRLGMDYLIPTEREKFSITN